jgi:hypothetical protein
MADVLIGGKYPKKTAFTFGKSLATTNGCYQKYERQNVLKKSSIPFREREIPKRRKPWQTDAKRTLWHRGE